MTGTAVHTPSAGVAPEKPARLARLGAWAGGHLGAVTLAWLVILAVFGAFAPQVESALSGAGWQDSTSASVRARDVIAKNFAGLGSTSLRVVVHDSARPIASDPVARQAVERATTLPKADPRVSTVVAPQPGVSLSRDWQTAVIQAGAKADANEMVRAADDLAGPLQRLSTVDVSVDLTGDSALWSNFNQVNHTAMIRSEVLSWPVTMAVLVLAFGSLVAAGLPLMLTLVGLLSAAGALVLATHIAPVSIWALNFALMFALALGIDYALFIVVRFRAALHRRRDEADRRQASLDAIAETMGTAGKAVAFSGVTVLVSLSTVLLVPSPAFRSMALGIMLSVVAVLAATLTLLPAVLGRLGRRIDAGRIRLSRRVHPPEAVRGLERVMHHWGAVLHRRPWIAGSLIGGAAAENHDLEQALSSRTPLVFGLLIGLGFLLLLVALGSPLIAFVGVVTNLASIAAAFGGAKLIFQDG